MGVPGVSDLEELLTTEIRPTISSTSFWLKMPQINPLSGALAKIGTRISKAAQSNKVSSR